MENRLLLSEDDILRNVHTVQESNDIEKINALQGRDFSIDMETGTGKTYVYLRIIFQLNKVYGFRKFIIVVLSIAVREGVLKSVDVTKEHFQTLYEKVPFDHFVYDSRRLGKVRQFAASNQIQIMVINIQSFQKDVADNDLSEMTEDELNKLNVTNRENNRISGRRPIEFIQAANPIVIIDEPQSVDNTENHAERFAISTLSSHSDTASYTAIPITFFTNLSDTRLRSSIRQADQSSRRSVEKTASTTPM